MNLIKLLKDIERGFVDDEKIKLMQDIYTITDTDKYIDVRMYTTLELKLIKHLALCGEGIEEYITSN